MLHMVVKKVSIALDEKVAEAAMEAAEHAGLSLSAWINAAAEEALALELGIAAIREFEAENGPLTDEHDEWVKDVLSKRSEPVDVEELLRDL